MTQNVELKWNYDVSMKKAIEFEEQLESTNHTLQSLHTEKSLKMQHIGEQDVQIEALQRELRRVKEA